MTSTSENYNKNPRNDNIRLSYREYNKELRAPRITTPLNLSTIARRERSAKDFVVVLHGFIFEEVG